MAKHLVPPGQRSVIGDGKTATSVALPAELIEAARDYARAGRAKRTQEAYRRCWSAFEAWCHGKGLQALPASPEIVAVWLAALAKGEGTRKPMARSSIDQALSAVIVRHRDAGHMLDRKHRAIALTWKGICNTKAKTEIKRQARPLLADDLEQLIGMLRTKVPGDARDGALLTLGWAAALRRSELVGLDWLERGDGTGYVQIDERGIIVTLMTSKASQEQAETIIIPSADMPAAREALDTWARMAMLQPGKPVFRPIDRRHIIGADRLTDRSVSRIIKSRVRALVCMRGRSEADADEIVASFSGHSMRSGYATSAAAEDMPSYRIQQHTRHKSAEMVASYIREADKWTKSGLKGVGF
jgi:integrase